jgi:hypothetical protein
MTTNNNVKRTTIASILLGIVNVLPAGAHHIEHHTSAGSHLWSHILIGLAVFFAGIGIYAIYNKKKSNFTKTEK